MHDTDARTPTDPTRRRRATARRRPGRAGWPVLLLVVGITAGVGVGTVHGGDRGLTASICDALERRGSPDRPSAPCAPNRAGLPR